MATSTAPASIAKVMRKVAKAFGLLQDDGFKDQYLQLLIDQPYARAIILQQLEWLDHRVEFFDMWYQDLPAEVREAPRNAHVSYLGRHMLTEYVIKTRGDAPLTINRVDDWFDSQIFEVPGFRQDDFWRIKVRLLMLGLRTD